MRGWAASALRSVGEHDGTVRLLSQPLIPQAFSQTLMSPETRMPAREGRLGSMQARSGMDAPIKE
jgi:hypothetical protein